ncbi:MAG: hypothetical protein ACT4QC_20460 [Planctomycetaceae bacterium]
MPSPPTAATVLDRVYLEVRCKLLDVAACLDRIDRAEGCEELQSDARLRQLYNGIALLESRGGDRAECVQMLFSDPYVAGWNRASNGRGPKTDS